MNLAGSIAWGLAASVRISGQTTDLDTFSCSIAQASDFATSGTWNVSVSATAAQVTAWATAARNVRGELFFDLKFFNTAATDPVLKTETIRLRVEPAVTP